MTLAVFAFLVLTILSTHWYVPHKLLLSYLGKLCLTMVSMSKGLLRTGRSGARGVRHATILQVLVASAAAAQR